jgi:hydrogenase expression/formation protein HypD
MTLKHMQEYRDADIARYLAGRIRGASTRPARLMEVCGTHTMSIFRSGIRSVLPDTLRLLSGPGCPVCVTSQGEIDAFIELARRDDVIVATFGDLMRVPGSRSSLQQERADGRDIRIVYSTMDALQAARDNPGRRVVFLGVGFETTAPTIAAAVATARQEEVANFSVYCAHKLVPPALAALMETDGVRVDGFLLPGHVSVIIGLDAYRPFFERYPVPAVVAGFEPTDILQAVAMLVEMIEAGRPQLANAYPRAVSAQGNPTARALIEAVFTTADAVWRGLGDIAASGLALRDEFEAHDARRVFGVEIVPVPEPKGCACGEILTGIKTPPDCPLYRKVCTPTDPVGPCMVSSEGTCAAYYRYHEA